MNKERKPTDGDIVLSARDVVKHYYKNEPQLLPDGTRRYRTTVRSVDKVSLDVHRGEIVGVLGETGCGKSTLGRLLTGLEPQTAGEILLNGEPTAQLLKHSSLLLRRKAQMIFQNPFDVFDVRHKIGRSLMDALILHGIGESREERIELIRTALTNADIQPAGSFVRRYPSDLSGGQLQRIAIVRSMLLNPEFVVADEPVSMLDVSVRADIINMLHAVAKKNRTAMVFISHDISTTSYITDRIAVMYLGELVELGNTADVIRRPGHPYTQALISNCPSTDPRKAFSPIRLEGEPPSAAAIPAGCRFAPRCRFAQKECVLSEHELAAIPGTDHAIRCPVMLSRNTL
jgi:peptide/nickel transport system ATP-binding protein